MGSDIRELIKQDLLTSWKCLKYLIFYNNICELSIAKPFEILFCGIISIVIFEKSPQTEWIFLGKCCKSLPYFLNNENTF